VLGLAVGLLVVGLLVVGRLVTPDDLVWPRDGDTLLPGLE